MSGTAGVRTAAVRRIAAGQSIEDVAAGVGASPETVMRWLARPENRALLACQLGTVLDVAGSAAVADLPARVAWLIRVADGAEIPTSEQLDAALALVNLARSLADRAILAAPLPDFELRA